VRKKHIGQKDLKKVKDHAEVDVQTRILRRRPDGRKKNEWWWRRRMIMREMCICTFKRRNVWQRKGGE
jgi:hypothetical protein